MLGFMTKDKKDTAPTRDQNGKNGTVEHGKKPEKYEDLLDDGVEVMPVVKVIEIIGTSTESFDDAVAKGVSVAAKSLRHITGADVKHFTVVVKDGALIQYRADLKVAFALEPDDDDDDED